MMSSSSGLLDFLFNNIFILIILINIFFRLFQKKSQEEDPVASSEIEWFDPDDQDFDDWVGDEEDSFDISSPNGSVSTNIRPEGELEEHIRSLLNFAHESVDEDEGQLSELDDLMIQYSALDKLVPSLVMFYQEIVASRTAIKSELKQIEGAFYEEATIQILNEMQELLHRIGINSEEIDLVYGLSQIFNARISDTQLAYRLMIDQLEPFKQHRYAEGIDLATYPLPAPPGVDRYQNQLKRYARGRFKWFVTSYDHLDDIATWPLQARSSAYVLSEITSDWSREWRLWCGSMRKMKLPAKSFRKLHWQIEDSLNVWGEQLLSAYIMALRYGPAAAHALLIEARMKSNQEKLVYIGSESGRSNFQTTTPPMLFEVEVVLATLRQMGFQREADICSVKWRELVGREMRCKVSGGSVVTLPIDMISEDVASWCQRISDQKWRAWNDERFSDIVGLVCSRGMWSLAESHTRQLVEGEKISSLPDHIHWLTVMNIAQAYPEYLSHAWRLTEQYLHHHLPIHEGSKHMHHTPGELTRDDLIAALVLSDLFERRTFRSQRT